MRRASSSCPGSLMSIATTRETTPAPVSACPTALRDGWMEARRAHTRSTRWWRSPGRRHSRRVSWSTSAVRASCPTVTRMISLSPMVDAAKAAIARHRDYVVGVKARLTEGVAADDMEVLRRAQEVATFFGLPLMIHMGQTASPFCAAAQRHRRRRRAYLSCGPRGSAPRSVVRRCQRAKGTSPLGHLRPHHASGVLARHDLHRRQRDEPKRVQRHRFPECNVAVSERRHDDR